MILGSHNSLSYLKPKTWWQRLFSFAARCQEVDIYSQYLYYNVKCFDIRLRTNKKGKLVIAHGLCEYCTIDYLLLILNYFAATRDDIYIRVLFEARNKKQYERGLEKFKDACKYLEETYPTLKFWCGRNLYKWEDLSYEFKYNPTCEEKYSSVCKPRLIDDWYPKWFAKRNNKQIIEQGTDKDILLIDFVNYGH
jgi:hypothetical protein